MNSGIRLTWRWPLAAASLVPLMLLLAIACGEGESREAIPPDRGSPPASDIPPAEARRELEAMSAAWADNPAKVAYDFTSNARPNFTELGAMTAYRSPQGLRLDISGSSAGSLFDDEDCDCRLAKSEMEETTLIFREDEAFRCTSGAEGEGECLLIDTPTDEADTLPFLRALITPGALSESVAVAITGADIGRTQEQIAGEEANCYTVGGSATEESDGTQWCFGTDGILLRLSGAYSDTPGAGPFRLEAITVSREVSDADFQLPYPLT
ncbi:MAG: hypothetical protein V3S00_00185 [Dehalococcoidia bacterium]